MTQNMVCFNWNITSWATPRMIILIPTSWTLQRPGRQPWRKDVPGPCEPSHWHRKGWEGSADSGRWQTGYPPSVPWSEDAPLGKGKKGGGGNNPQITIHFIHQSINFLIDQSICRSTNQVTSHNSPHLSHWAPRGTCGLSQESCCQRLLGTPTPHPRSTAGLSCPCGGLPHDAGEVTHSRYEWSSNIHQCIHTK